MLLLELPLGLYVVFAVLKGLDFAGTMASVFSGWWEPFRYYRLHFSLAQNELMCAKIVLWIKENPEYFSGMSGVCVICGEKTATADSKYDVIIPVNRQCDIKTSIGKIVFYAHSPDGLIITGFSLGVYITKWLFTRNTAAELRLHKLIEHLKINDFSLSEKLALVDTDAAATTVAGA